MKKSYFIFFILLVLFSFSSHSEEESFSASKKTTEALLSYPKVAKRAEYWGYRLQKMAFGEYADEVLMVSPLVLGKIEFKLLDFDVELNYRSQKSKVQYTYKF